MLSAASASTGTAACGSDTARTAAAGAVITGDVGGTSARMRVWLAHACVSCAAASAHAGPCVLEDEPVLEDEYASKEFASLAALLQRVMRDACAKVPCLSLPPSATGTGDGAADGSAPPPQSRGCDGVASPGSGSDASAAGGTSDASATPRVTFTHAAVALCGPVNNGHVFAENLKWDETISQVQATTGIASVDVLNDFVALGLGLSQLSVTCASGTSAVVSGDGGGTAAGAGAGAGAGGGASVNGGAPAPSKSPEVSAPAPGDGTGADDADVVTLHAAPRVPGAPMASIGAGTGLGMVTLTWEPPQGGRGGQYVPWPSEGGMTRFCAQTQEEWDMALHIARRAGDPHVETEHVVSGQVRAGWAREVAGAVAGRLAGLVCCSSVWLG